MTEEQEWDDSRRVSIGVVGSECLPCEISRQQRHEASSLALFNSMIDHIGDVLQHRRPTAFRKHQAVLDLPLFGRPNADQRCPASHPLCRMLSTKHIAGRRWQTTFGRPAFILWSYKVNSRGLGYWDEKVPQEREIYLYPDGILALDNPHEEPVSGFYDGPAERLASSRKSMTYRELQLSYFGPVGANELDTRVRQLLACSTNATI
jgi:hypothetical protein